MRSSDLYSLSARLKMVGDNESAARVLKKANAQKKKEQSMPRETPRQPMWCCAPCGNQFGNRPPTGYHWAAYEKGMCEVCNEWTMVTEPRDFGYLKRTWRGASRAPL